MYQFKTSFTDEIIVSPHLQWDITIRSQLRYFYHCDRLLFEKSNLKKHMEKHSHEFGYDPKDKNSMNSYKYETFEYVRHLLMKLPISRQNYIVKRNIKKNRISIFDIINGSKLVYTYDMCNSNEKIYCIIVTFYNAKLNTFAKNQRFQNMCEMERAIQQCDLRH